MMSPKLVAELLPQVTVVPVNPLTREMASWPVIGLAYPLSESSVQLVGGVMVAGFAPFTKKPRVGLLVRQAAANVTAGVAGPT